MQPIITLTTDFGLTDEYVGVMKVVLLARAGDVHIIDLCHTVPPQDVRHAALILAASYTYFPPGTLNIVVVDPGVGTGRRILLVRAAGQMFLAPDNGVLTPVMEEGVFESVHAVTNTELFLPKVSSTFHGRDIFAPVAAQLIRGLPPEKAGPRLDEKAPLRLPPQAPEIDQTHQTIAGSIIAFDHFGNCITNIHETTVREMMPGNRLCPVFHVGNFSLEGLAATYADAGHGEMLALVGSRGTVEIARNQGDAHKTLNAGIGMPVTVSFMDR